MSSTHQVPVESPDLDRKPWDADVWAEVTDPDDELYLMGTAMRDQ